MKRLGIISLLLLLVAVALAGWWLSAQKQAEPGRGYMKKLGLGRTLELRPRKLPTGGDPGAHACIRGDYNHVYTTSAGWHGDEVWLCCIPVHEILRDSFQCSASLIPEVFGSSDYSKIRFCGLLHPTETEATYIPVCVPAPLTAPGLDQATR